MSNLDNENSQIAIEGGSDGTVIGNVSDFLKVTAAENPTPAGRIVYFDETAKNGGSPELNVDGSVTPATFTVGPPAGQSWYIFEFGISIQDSGSSDTDKYGALAALANGVDLIQYVNSVEYTFKVLKTNLDIVEAFSDHGFRGTANAFLNSNNFYTGKTELRQPVTLNGDDSDEIRVVINDDLTGLEFHQFNIEYFRVV